MAVDRLAQLVSPQRKQIVRLYKTRRQIEEGFRDTQSVAYGLGIANGRHTMFVRAANLLLIAALASFLLWLIGCLAEARLAPTGERPFVEQVADVLAYLSRTIARPIHSQPIAVHLPG